LAEIFFPVSADKCFKNYTTTAFHFCKYHFRENFSQNIRKNFCANPSWEALQGWVSAFFMFVTTPFAMEIL